MQNNIYGYAPLDEKEMDDLAKKYMPVLDPRFIKAVRKDGEIVAFVIGMPDMTAGIRKARGRLFPFGILLHPPGRQEDQTARPHARAPSRTSTGAWAWT